jgi:predicted dehydrogenase
VESIERNRVKFLLWNRNRLPALMQAEKWVQDGEIGEIRSAHVDFYFSKDAGPSLGSRRPGDPPIDWLEFQRAAHADGSDGAVGSIPIGEMRNEAIYPLAYIRQLTAARFERAYARSAVAFHQVNADNHVEDVGTISLEMSGGRLATVSIGRIGAASHPDLGEIKISLIGTQGALVIAEARPEIAVYYRGQPTKEFRRRRIAVENDFLLADNFARSIADDLPTILNEHAAYEIAATVEAALRSAASNQFEPVTSSSGNRL